MTDATGFTHITVSTDDDDDVVIQAGIADDPAEAPAVPEPAGPAEGAEAEVPAAVAEVAVAESAAAEAAEAPAPAPAPRLDDGYRETTLEDIQSAPMSSTQKVVIVVALLGIIAFAAWDFLAR